MSAERSPSESPNVPWPDLVKFVRQLGHDIRNNLNAVELQSAYLAELAEGGELKGEVQRLREMIAGIGMSLQKLTASLAHANPTFMAYSAADFVEDMKQKVATDFPNEASKVTWDVQLKDEQVQIDPLMAQQALLELFANAFQHERNVKMITVKAHVYDGRFVFELHEPKAKFELSTENWGREPLRHLGQGRYGLGLNRARRIIQSLGGDFGAQYDRASSTLMTKVSLPVTPR